MTDNVSRPINVADNVSETEKQYKFLTIALDPIIHRALKIMAIDEETTVGNIMGEAVATWMKWMRKAEYREQLKENKDAEEAALAKERLKKAEELLAYAQAKKKERRKKKAIKKHDAMMQARYPYLDWKRAKNLPNPPPRPYRKSTTGNVANHVSGTEKCP